MDTGKEQNYKSLVSLRKKCRTCKELENPAQVERGRYDSSEIGPFTRWQGNLKADILVIGQDWGDVDCLIKNHGIEPLSNPTNMALIKLFNSIGIKICTPNKKDNRKEPAFFTNAYLCLKKGGLQANVKTEWFNNCGIKFLKPTIELIKPKALITLGEKAYRSLEELYELPSKFFRSVVDENHGIVLSEKTTLLPMYHCGVRIQNTHRPLNQQMKDWKRIKKYI